MGDVINRLRLTDHSRWRPLAEQSQREQCVPLLTYWQTPWENDPYVWGAEREGVLLAYVTWTDAKAHMIRGKDIRPSLLHMDYLPSWAMMDLYTLPQYRGQHIPSRFIQQALMELGIHAEEPVALSMPVQESARGPLQWGLGRDRAVVGYSGEPGHGPVIPGTCVRSQATS